MVSEPLIGEGWLNRIVSEPLVGEGCDFFPDGTWKHCCDKHDIDFNVAGDFSSFLQANTDLASCVAANGGGWVVAGIMLFGVMTGGALVWKWKRLGGKSIYEIITGKKY